MLFDSFDYEEDDGPELRKCSICGSLKKKENKECLACKNLNDTDLATLKAKHAQDIVNQVKIGQALVKIRRAH